MNAKGVRPSGTKLGSMIPTNADAGSESSGTLGNMDGLSSAMKAEVRAGCIVLLLYRSAEVSNVLTHFSRCSRSVICTVIALLARSRSSLLIISSEAICAGIG
jgi:hypothetical protein